MAALKGMTGALAPFSYLVKNNQQAFELIKSIIGLFVVSVATHQLK